MKKLFAFLLSMLTVCLISASAFAANAESDIGNITDSIIEATNELLSEDLSRSINESDIDLSLAYKIYVDTNVFHIDSNNAEIISNALESGNYIYELPIYIDNSTIIVNLSKGLPLNENADFTAEEKEQVLANVGKWQVSAVKFYAHEIVDYNVIIENAVDEVPENTMLVGSLPNFRYAVALIPNDNGEITQLIPLSGVPNIERISRFSMNNNVYDYEQTKNFVNTLPPPNPNESSGYGFPEENTYNYLFPIILSVACLAVIGFVIVNKKVGLKTK